MTPEEKSKLEKQFRRFQKKYFKGRLGFTGEENHQCKLEFARKKGIKL